ncbi:MAG: hypothetical protein E7159_02060 [Firmicutes bacterium]|nr:hypothetical protein [Bacillota bacterium]
MKQYKLVKQGDNIILFKYNEETNSYIVVPNITIERLFSILDNMLESKKIIEKIHLVDSVLEIKTIYLNDDGDYREETIKIQICNKILDNSLLRDELYSRLNRYNAILKTETNDNIAHIRFNPNNVRKRRLEEEKRLMHIS